MWDLTKLYIVADLLRPIMPIIMASAVLSSVMKEVKR